MASHCENGSRFAVAGTPREATCVVNAISSAFETKIVIENNEVQNYDVQLRKIGFVTSDSGFIGDVSADVVGARCKGCGGSRLCD